MGISTTKEGWSPSCVFLRASFQGWSQPMRIAKQDSFSHFNLGILVLILRAFVHGLLEEESSSVCLMLTSDAERLAELNSRGFGLDGVRGFCGARTMALSPYTTPQEPLSNRIQEKTSLFKSNLNYL